ncbi:hypothetical protein BDF22DRAFT_685962 [Syncephalis plumigaleata]|nr:hypothetical protein BDF22DRAFT_685962 [Syncephalis plumigaleata]
MWLYSTFKWRYLFLSLFQCLVSCLCLKYTTVAASVFICLIKVKPCLLRLSWMMIIDMQVSNALFHAELIVMYYLISVFIRVCIVNTAM